ncbi:hypothetical protein ROA7450_02515 [Roseovarius albus]|uniref:Integral membrane protein (DUF2244) n=1 Tax=Roseovarius albus TaxID=1247867 RepID=A0A1X6ZFV5_9RHOB|nr:DUF2244 domain-containing protein [Roseovarius albus]SLN50628.1 hypothetical protein ROA7450_02515 [Roseovarius albus]
MSYEWSDTGNPSERRLVAQPYRSLSRRGFAGFILITFGVITIPLYPLLGTFVLWGLLPFLLLAVAGLWWALEYSYFTGRLVEELTITPKITHLRRMEPNGTTREWKSQSYWVKVTLHQSGGPVENYLTLKGNGREVELGAFLSEDERKALYVELLDVLNKAKAANRP